MSEQRFIEAMATGLINPFGPSGPEGDALLASTQISGEVRRAQGTTDQLDARFSREIFKLPAGALAVALGAEARREALKDTPGTSFNLGDILGGGGAIEPQDASRRVQAAFVEFAVPTHKTLEALVSARYDHYTDFGGTTNPKVALRWQPVRSLLLRGSWGMGFRAPTLPDLFTPIVEGLSGSDKGDALRCPITQLPSDCDLFAFRVRSGGNRALQPEHSEQAAAGIVWEPVNGVSVGLDYWKIRKTGVINALTDDIILGYLDVYGNTNVLRGPPDPAYPDLPGPIQTLIEWNQNVGDRRTSGFDIDLHARSPATPAGRFSFGLQGTYIVDWTDHLNGLPAESSAGRYSAFGPTLRRRIADFFAPGAEHIPFGWPPLRGITLQRVALVFGLCTLLAMRQGVLDGVELAGFPDRFTMLTNIFELTSIFAVEQFASFLPMAMLVTVADNLSTGAAPGRRITAPLCCAARLSSRAPISTCCGFGWAVGSRSSSTCHPRCCQPKCHR